MSTTSLISNRGVRDAYDYRVALPLAMVAAVCLVFVAVSGHKQVPLNSSNTAAKTIPSEATLSVQSPSPQTTFSSDASTKNVDLGTTPSTINTADPQTTTSANTGDAPSSGVTSSTGMQGSGASTPEAGTPSSSQFNEANDIINDLTNIPAKVVNKGSSETLKLLSSL